MDKINTKQAAEMLGITRGRLTQLIHEGIIKADKWGRDYMIDPGQLPGLTWPGRRVGARPVSSHEKSRQELPGELPGPGEGRVQAGPTTPPQTGQAKPAPKPIPRATTPTPGPALPGLPLPKPIPKKIPKN